MYIHPRVVRGIGFGRWRRGTTGRGKNNASADMTRIVERIYNIIIRATQFIRRRPQGIYMSIVVVVVVVAFYIYLYTNYKVLPTGI